MNQLEPKGLICGIKKVSNFALSKKSCVQVHNWLKGSPQVASILKSVFLLCQFGKLPQNEPFRAAHLKWNPE